MGIGFTFLHATVLYCAQSFPDYTLAIILSFSGDSPIAGLTEPKEAVPYSFCIGERVLAFVVSLKEVLPLLTATWLYYLALRPYRALRTLGSSNAVSKCTENLAKLKCILLRQKAMNAPAMDK
jgi:hypothetical protein